MKTFTQEQLRCTHAQLIVGGILFVLEGGLCSLVAIGVMAASREKMAFRRHSSEIAKSLTASHATCIMLANEMYLPRPHYRGKIS